MMTAGIFEDIRKRVIYLSEVQKHVLDVLQDFRADAANAGGQITINGTSSTVMGSTIEIIETGAKKSSIYAEIFTTGNIEIMRECSVNGTSGEAIEEQRSLDFSKEPEALAADILLILARDHLGFVGAKLEAYLNNQVFADPNQSFDQGFEL